MENIKPALDPIEAPWNTALVVPCYNEEKRFNPQAFVDYSKSHPLQVFFFVNDCSTDATGREIDAVCISAPKQLRAIHLEKNEGKANAVRHGFLQAFREDFQAIGFWDADLATPLEEIPNLLNALRNPRFSMVMGARVGLLQYGIERSRKRHYLGRVFATLASATLGFPVYDTQCGAKFFRNTDELHKVFSVPFEGRWTFDVEILARFNLLAQHYRTPPIQQRAAEIPLETWRDIPGSKVNPTDFFIAIAELFRIFRSLHSSPSKRLTQQLIASNN